MAEHIIQTQNPSDGIIIRLRYDTYDNWANSDKILKIGEAAIAAFPDTRPNRPPKAIGIKIGNGRHYFDELPWIQALAADVYSWAKESEKPTYTADEIEGLAAFIASHGSGSGGSGGGGAYQIVYYSNTSKYVLQHWNDADQVWEDTASEINLSGILNRLNTIERWANGANTQLGNIEIPLSEYIYEEVIKYMNRLDYNDSAVAHEFVTAVSETDGVISVQRSGVSANDILAGVLTTEYGGTGLNRVDADEALVGSLDGTITTKTIQTEIDEIRNSLVTSGAIQDYVESQTEGLEDAMHFKGETTVTILPNSHTNPQIPGYNFRLVQAGDVILANNTQEFMWTGTEWRLLGDEGSYAIKGEIVNADISEEANIAQSKIAGLADAFDRKVDKVEGKQLSTNDYTTEEKQKLQGIEEGAQVNVIEHIFLNDEEIQPSTVSGLHNSIDMHFNGMSQEQSDKLDGIEAGAQVNPTIQVNSVTVPPVNGVVNLQIKEFSDEDAAKLNNLDENAIKKITFDGTDYTADGENTVTINSDPHTEHENKIEHIFINNQEVQPTTINGEAKSIDITIDVAALDLNVIEGAIVPNGNSTENVDISNKKLVLSRIAKTGDVMDLHQSYDTYIILNCGTSTTVMD